MAAAFILYAVSLTSIAWGNLLHFMTGRVWTNYDEARWRGVRDQAHERLYELLQDRHPEVMWWCFCIVMSHDMYSVKVRAAAVYALCTFVDNQRDPNSDHAAHVNQAVGATLAQLYRHEACVLVRCELASALQCLVTCYDANFAAIAFRFAEEEKSSEPFYFSKNHPRISISQQGKGQKSSFDLPANYSSMRQGRLMILALVCFKPWCP